MKNTNLLCLCVLFAAFVASLPANAQEDAANAQEDAAKPIEMLKWSELHSLPNELGVAGPFAGVHNDCLIVAGGANFPQPIWESEKKWYETIHVLQKQGDHYDWFDGGKLPRATGYGAAVSTKQGVVCIGGNNANEPFADVYLLSCNREKKQLTTTDYPSLPKPVAFSSAALAGDVIYLAGGQSGQSLDSAMNQFWSLDLSRRGNDDFQWQELDPLPGPTRAFHLTIHQRNGNDDCIYVISGRRQRRERTEFLKDNWEYNISKKTWRRRADVPQCVMAGTGIGIDRSRIFVLGGADGTNFHIGASIKDQHPGFPKKSFAYHTISDTWIESGTTPANHVTTIAVKWGEQIVIPSGEIKPKVRSPKIWSVKAEQLPPSRRNG